MGAGNLFMMCETPRKEAFFPLAFRFSFPALPGRGTGMVERGTL